MNRKIKILFTTTNFNTAGSGKVIYDLVKGLDKTKFDVEIACRHSRGDFFKEIEALGVPIHIIDVRTPYKPYYNLINRIQPVVQFFKTNTYDIIHSWHWSSDWTEVLAARLAGVNYVYTKKAMSWGNIHWKIKSYLSDFIITINDEMKGYFPYKKAQALIPLGIDADYYKPSVEVDEEIGCNTFTILMVANLVPIKGVEVLLQAIKHTKDSHITLNILGDYDNAYGHDMLALKTTLGLDAQVCFLGKQPDVRPYISQSDLYVIPTLDAGRKEGMPMALVEAMSMGIPLLGSDISGINFVLKDFQNLLFEAGNSEVLAHKLIEMKNSSKGFRQELGTRLRKYCIAHFAMHEFIAAHENLYIKLKEK